MNATNFCDSLNVQDQEETSLNLLAVQSCSLLFLGPPFLILWQLSEDKYSKHATFQRIIEPQ